MATNLILDLNAIGYSNHYGKKLTYNGMQTQAIYGTLQSIRVLYNEYRGASRIGLWDGRAQWRFDMHPSYKSKREDPKRLVDKKAYAEQRPYIQRAFTLLGIPQITVSDAEADDIAGFMSRDFVSRNADTKVVLVTKDHDWIQLVNANVDFYNIADRSIINAKNFTKMTGYLSGREFLAGKALQGDSSDDIPGVGGIGEKGAAEFMAKYGSVKAFFMQMPKTDEAQAHIKDTLKQYSKAEIGFVYGGGIERCVKNMKLMNLIDAPKPDAEKTKITRGKFDEDEFWKFCEELGFSSILHDFDKFTQPFKTH